MLVWDVGTGSGAIAVAVAVEARRRGYARDVVFRATDVSADALGVATINAVSHGVADRIEFGVADLTELAAPAAADLLLANLPYVPADKVPTLPLAAGPVTLTIADGVLRLAKGDAVLLATDMRGRLSNLRFDETLIALQQPNPRRLPATDTSLSNHRYRGTTPLDKLWIPARPHSV